LPDILYYYWKETLLCGIMGPDAKPVSPAPGLRHPGVALCPKQNLLPLSSARSSWSLSSRS
jgi:hypothetical protein